MQSVNKEMPVLVTGASGYIASWLVKQLLEDGFTVHGTVRNPGASEKVAHLEAMGKEHPGKLKLFKADLLENGSFADAMAGCQIVMHTASPFIFGRIKDPQKQLIDPALKGTENVLASVNQTASVERVVLTSSVVAVYSDSADIAESGKLKADESMWNTKSSLKHQPYNYSKTLAEKKAWEMAKAQDRWDLLTINPGFVLGPSLSKRIDGVSTSTILNMLNGQFKSGVPNQTMGVVDVRDVAKAHLLAGTTSGASGRHLTVAESKTFLEMANIIDQHTDGKYPIPKSVLPKFLMYLVGPAMGMSWKSTSRNYGYDLQFDNSYVKKDLGMNFRPFSDTLKDQIEQLIQDGHVNN